MTRNRLLISVVDVRFKGNGLESIEVQDNGVGISIENYETVGESFTVCMAFFALLMLVPALKHYTSKLASYDDLSSLQTFGFRGEALSSLCALSNFHLVTARADDAPKGTRLDFEISGRLKSTQVVASTKGTTVAVENLSQTFLCGDVSWRRTSNENMRRSSPFFKRMLVSALKQSYQ